MFNKSEINIYISFMEEKALIQSKKKVSIFFKKDNILNKIFIYIFVFKQAIQK